MLESRLPRFDPALTPEQRCHQDNGIWLCQNCGKLVDNDETRYDATLLRAWKTIAENRALNSIGKTAQPPHESDEQRKLRAILPWKDKTIKLTQMTPPGNGQVLIGRERGSSFCQVFDCNEFVVTVGKTGNDGFKRAIPLSSIKISYDTAHEWLELQEDQPTNHALKIRKGFRGKLLLGRISDRMFFGTGSRPNTL